MDKYDEAIIELTNHPEMIFSTWSLPHMHPAGCLFAFCGNLDNDPFKLGCLTQVKSGNSVAENVKLTDQIRGNYIFNSLSYMARSMHGYTQ